MTSIAGVVQTDTKEETLRNIVDEYADTLKDAPWILALRSGSTVSFVKLKEQMDEWRLANTSLGLECGDRVGLLIFDPLVFAATFVSLICSGIWVAPLDPNLSYASGPRLDDRARNLDLRAIVSDRAAPALSRSAWINVSAKSLAVTGELQRGHHPEGSDGGVILATSGTSGTPKVTALPSAQLLCAAQLVAHHSGLTTSDRGFNPLPLWHINAEVVAVLASLVAGASLVIDDGFHRTDFWPLIDRLEVTWINAVPAIMSRLVEIRPGESVPARIRFIRSASAPLSTAVLDEFEHATGIQVVESYGMTEAASQICANPVDGLRKPGSVGPAVGVEVRVIPDSNVAESGMLHAGVGNVQVKGPSVIRSYEGHGYEDRFDAQGWLETGDLGYLDEDGYLFLVGRSDDVINRSGEKIFPREIEDVILGVQGVDFAAVVGEADETFGQVPIAYVQLDGLSSSTSPADFAQRAAEIENALVLSVARTRRPARLLIVENMPIHATGKVQKNRLDAKDLKVLFEKEL